MRLAVLSLVAVTLAVSAGTGPAIADSPPSFVTAWGSRGTDPGQFKNPQGVAVDSVGNVYVADTNNNRIQKFTAAGVFLAQWGTYGPGNGQFDQPWAIAVDADDNVYVTEHNNHRVQRFSATGTFLTTWGTRGTGNGQFDSPFGIAVDGDGNVYVSEYGNSRVQKFTATGDYLLQWGTRGTGPGEFQEPQGVAVDGAGHVFVADYSNHRVQKFTSTGTFLTDWGTQGTGDGQFDYPAGVAVDDDGTVYVTEYIGNRVQRFTSTGAFLTKWGTPGSGEGAFSQPPGVAVDTVGNVFVADNGNNRIQRFGDRTEPTVEIVTPSDGAAFARNQAVNADFSCADEPGGSGLATCEGTVDDGTPLATATIGDHEFTVTATDDAGNVTVQTNTYRVAPARPDGRIKRGSTGSYVGNDVYNTTGAGQTRTGSAVRGGTVTYFVSAQNDAPFADALRLRGTASTSRFRVKYTTGGNGITNSVTAGTYTTPVLAPGATFTVKVEVTVLGAAPVGSSLDATVVIKSSVDQARKDTVRFITSRR